MQSNCARIVAVLWLSTFQAASAADQPDIITRADWGAKAAVGKMKQQKPVAILVHHTGSKGKPNLGISEKMKGLQRFSQNAEKLADGRLKPAWPDVPYHFYIAVDGKVAEGRNINSVGDTNTGYNPMGYIQVVVEGNFDVEQVTEAQKTSLKAVLAWLQDQYAIKPTMVFGHSGKAQTACPGKNLEALLTEFASP